jgi:hypothetical protein
MLARIKLSFPWSIMLFSYFLCSLSGWIMASTATKDVPEQSLVNAPPISAQEKLQDDVLSPNVRIFMNETLGDDSKQRAAIVAHALDYMQLDSASISVCLLGSLMQRKFAAEASLGALRKMVDWKATDMKALFLNSNDDSDFVSILILDLATQRAYGAATTEHAILRMITGLRGLSMVAHISCRESRKTVPRDGQLLEDRQGNMPRLSSLIGTVFGTNRSYLKFCQRLRFFLRLHLQMPRKGWEDTKGSEEANAKWRLLYRTISRNSLRPIRVSIEEATRHLPWLYYSRLINLLGPVMRPKQTSFALLLEGPCSPAKFSDAPRSFREWQHCLQKYAEDGHLHGHVRRELLDVKYPAPLLHTLKLSATTPQQRLLGFLMAHAMAVAYRERFWLDSLLDDSTHHDNSDSGDYYDDHDGEHEEDNAQYKEEGPVLKADDWRIVADVEHSAGRSVS